MTKREIVKAIDGIICTIKDDTSVWNYDKNELSEDYLDDVIGDAECLSDDLVGSIYELQALLNEAEKESDWMSKYVYLEDLIPKAFPGTVVRIYTQFSGEWWLPYPVEAYMNALYDLNDHLEKVESGTTKTVSYQNWPAVYESNVHKPNQTLAEILSNTFPKRDFSKDADHWAEVLSRAWADERYECIFDLLSGTEGEYQKYTVPYEDSHRDDSIVVYYPTSKYSETDIKAFIRSKRDINQEN